MKQQEQKEQEFDFIKEKIKEKPINKRRLLIQAGFKLFCAIIFGAVACFVFVLLRPYMEEWLNPKEESTISIPRDDLVAEEENGEETPEEDSNPQEGNAESSSKEDKKDSNQEDAEDGPKGESPKDDSDGQGKEPGKDSPEQENAPPPQETLVVQEELEVENYQELQDKLYDIGKEANKSVVTVTGVTSGMDWFDTPYENENRAAGIVIANNGQELLILTEKKVIADAQEISITFINETVVSASLKKYDGNTGIAIISVPLGKIPKETLEQMAVASLGNSYLIKQGTTVLAIGSPLGVNYSILCGTITSSQNEVTTIDRNYTIFTTDIVGSETGSGVLINLEGEIIGLVLQDYSNQSDRNTITALSVSEMKQMIEDLSNGRDVPYVGLRLSTVTEDIAKEFHIPKGVYVKTVVMDSPAMAAGLQEADVIVRINGEDVATVEQYNQKIYALNPEDPVVISIKRQNGEEYVDLDCSAVAGVLK